MSSKHALGRGLGALIRDGAATAAPLGGNDRDLDIEQIGTNTLQPRQIFLDEPLDDLTESIRSRGVLQPLLVRKTSGAMYELIAGERRLRAATAAGLKSVPVKIIEASDQEALELALIENLQRENLNPIEEAEGYRLLIDRFGLTQDQIAKSVGKARASVANALRLLNLGEEVRALISAGLLSTGHAKVLAGISDDIRQLELARACIERGYSVRQIEQLAAKASRPTIQKTEKTPDLPDAYVVNLSMRLHQHFGTSVRITPTNRSANGKKSKGTVEVDFYSNDDLSRILELMGVSLE